MVEEACSDWLKKHIPGGQNHGREVIHDEIKHKIQGNKRKVYVPSRTLCVLEVSGSVYL
jgi:hypothetical protein